jgi:hypothetical protein
MVFEKTVYTKDKMINVSGGGGIGKSNIEKTER